MNVALWASLFWGWTALAAAPPERLLRCAWTNYHRNFVQRDGRVIDPAGGNISTSEGQAYGMIRAVWIDDQNRFDAMRNWTRDNLQGGDFGALPAWKWGERDDGSWGVLDTNPAADADQWMAYALLFAAEIWDEPDYRRQALELLDAIWSEETEELLGRRYMLPGPWARTAEAGDVLRLNPSYFLPFAWRVFSVHDVEHDWMAMVDDHYTLLEEVMADGSLPPDWLFLHSISGEFVVPPPHLPEAAYFGYEAWRLSWTLAAEVAWYDEPRARALLVPVANLGTNWRRDGRIVSQLDTDGSPVTEHDYLGLYGALLPAWALARPEDVNALYTRHIEPQRARHGWGDAEDYYSNNWVWLGIALWNGIAAPLEES